MRHLDLFSGIGGFALAAEKVWPGAVTHTFCDNDPFAQAVLRKHWPEARIYSDIRTLKGSDVGPTDLVTGGFPCQPFSSAGKRRGMSDDRHLWPEMLRVIRETTPRFVIGENVAGLLTWDGGLVLENVLADLEGAGYEARPIVIPAAGVGAPHRRDRVWIIAENTKRVGRSDGEAREKRDSSGELRIASARDSKRIRDETEANAHGSDRTPADPASIGQRGRRGKERGTEQARRMVESEQGRDEARRQDERRDWSDWYETATRLCTVDDGLPGGVVRPRGWRNAALKAAGNAIVPQVAEEIMRAIRDSQV